MPTCPCCAHAVSRPLFRVKDHAYVECVRCASAWLDPLPVVDLSELYGEGYFVAGDDRGGYVDYDRDERLHRRNARARLEFVSGFLPPTRPADAIDVGCASGYVLDEYRRAGLVPHGVDVSAWARQQAGARGHDTHATLDKALGAADRPVLVSFFQSLEHMPDPDGAVAEAAAALPTGGVIAIETWDRLSRIARLSGTRWQQANPPSVLHLFTREGLERLAERHGLRIERMEATSKLVSPALAAGVIAHRAPKAARALTSVLDVTRLGHVAVPYRLGDLITLVAVKR
jgi:SAM-dependent methyltransferase